MVSGFLVTVYGSYGSNLLTAVDPFAPQATEPGHRVPVEPRRYKMQNKHKIGIG